MAVISVFSGLYTIRFIIYDLNDSIYPILQEITWHTEKDTCNTICLFYDACPFQFCLIPKINVEQILILYI